MVHSGAAKDPAVANTLSPALWAALHENRKTLTRAQERAFLAAALDQDDQTRLLCELLYFTGCRLSEALALQRDHIDNMQHFVVIHTLKQRGAPALRAVPVPRSLINRLTALPVGRDGRLWPYSRWTARRRLLPVLRAAGIDGVAACSHALRHSYNARGKRCGLSEGVRCLLLGHRSVRTNEGYGAPLGYELRDQVRQLWD